jgi:PAS domain S-box-containing protein
LDASPDAVLLVDAGGQIIYANDRVNDLLGYDSDELVGDMIERLVPEDARGTHVADREAYLEDPETRPMGAGLELSARREDGSTFPVDITLSPIEVDGDRYVITVVRDISDRKALYAEYRTILEAVPDAVVVADVDTHEIVKANEQVAALCGREPGDLVGKPQTALHPTDREERYRELFERSVDADDAIFTQFPDGSTIYVATEDGREVPVEINAHVFELDDRRLVASVFRDVTSRKERERALERLHAASHDLMSATSTEEVARIASETVTRVLGLPLNGVHLHVPHEAALVCAAGSDALETMFDGSPPAIPAGSGLAWEAYSTGESRIYGDVREATDVLNEDTSFRSEMYLPLGEHGVLVVGSTRANDFDATDEALAHVLAANVEAALDRVEREQELRQQNERLEEFASIVSHDLRNPLNVAEGRLALARDEVDSEHLADVARAHDRMETLIEDLLTVARLGESGADADVVELAETVDRCWWNVETGSATLVADAECALRADESRLQQLLENLVRNAVEHGGADVTVTVGDLADGFYVEDDGPGIPEEKRPQVFEAGYTTAGGGTGFGLYIVDQIAAAHGWDVTATAGDDGGARFEITDVEFER